MFYKEVFFPKDALTVFIPDGQKVSVEVQKVLDDAGEQRWYSKEGGQIVKCPCVADSFDDEIFTFEKGGWEHEHCNGCGATISTGEICWIGEGDEVIIMCNKCHGKLR